MPARDDAGEMICRRWAVRGGDYNIARLPIARGVTRRRAVASRMLYYRVMPLMGSAYDAPTRANSRHRARLSISSRYSLGARARYIYVRMPLRRAFALPADSAGAAARREPTSDSRQS